MRHNKTITADDNRQYTRVSRWIKITFETVTPRHSLFVYGDGDDKEREVITFRHGGKKYALGQFLRLDYPIMWTDDNGKLNHLSGYDCENYYNPLLIEIDDGGEAVRLWEVARA